MDNEEAKISVGQNVPYITRQDTTETLTDYTSYEYKDVGVTLQITPQINQERFVRLKIFQEIQILQEENELTPSTFKRTTETTVTVRDKHTVVISGLIGETLDQGEYKVPLLGDIPVLGYLFKSTAETRNQTNLYIFVTPHVIENPDDARTVYEEKKDQMDQVQVGNIKLYKGKGPQTDDMALSDRGYQYLMGREYDKADECFEQSLEINPENPYALFHRGTLCEETGERNEAIRLYQELISLDPEERLFSPSDPELNGRKLKDIAEEHLENLMEEKNETNR
jgi:general secretion pathway protein D